MRRLHLVELEDLPWFPAPIRDGATAFLAFAGRLGGFAPPLARRLEDALRRTGAKRIVDLCSGAAGPMVHVLKRLPGGVPVVLTDLYPNLDAFEAAARASGGQVSYVAEPVDATRVGAELPGLRTLCNAFHHFDPSSARQVLLGAVEARQPIAIFEIVDRWALPVMPLVGLTSFLLMPFVKPRRADWLALTYVLPLIPLLLVFDGSVSCLRVYMPAELRKLTDSLGDVGYRWEIERFPVGPMRATWMLGYPAEGVQAR